MRTQTGRARGSNAYPGGSHGPCLAHIQIWKPCDNYKGPLGPQNARALPTDRPTDRQTDRQELSLKTAYKAIFILAKSMERGKLETMTAFFFSCFGKLCDI